ncbi:MAG TPA: hypothetical protein VLF67_02795 [Candidatus Saccharimonas sp.]|nr:hypothetical protein [Candidatus Saccharimonas sp.]
MDDRNIDPYPTHEEAAQREVLALWPQVIELDRAVRAAFELPTDGEGRRIVEMPNGTHQAAITFVAEKLREKQWSLVGSAGSGWYIAPFTQGGFD